MMCVKCGYEMGPLHAHRRAVPVGLVYWCEACVQASRQPACQSGTHTFRGGLGGIWHCTTCGALVHPQKVTTAPVQAHAHED